VGEGCVIADGVVIEEGAEIGAGSWIEANTVIGRSVKIGKGCRIGANCVISHSIIGDNVRIYPGCCIGQDGFGFAIDPTGFVKIPQLGRVIIEDSVEIGAGCTIDRGAGPDTVIGQGTWLDNLIQIGHNVKVGRGCIMAAQGGISGSTVLEDYVVLAGQVGVAGHLRIGKGARIAAKSGLLRDVPAGAEQMGYPAVPVKQFFKQFAYLGRAVTK
jgi:UDP-3-O-[3-hydroxymyristoyl] glucosamine N-acyltransferase